ncbi:MAG: hypothetical protein ABIP75_00405, partial [Pyrinomonadaceae bacterium]
YVVFGQFIPVSIGKGLNLAEGIGDYDHEAKFGMPHSDTEMMALEAKWHNRPEYANSFFVPDGIERDRDLTARSFAIMRANPGWFSTVLLRRGAMMLRMERVPAMDQRALSAGREPAPLRIAGDTLSLFQRPFITALFLPLSLAGFIILWRRREQRAFALPLAAGVIYFLVVHSWLHTEYRYVQLIPTIELILATTTVMSIVDRLGRRRINLAKN